MKANHCMKANHFAKVFIAATAFLAFLPQANAQLVDSLVNIVAYWTPGEKFSYLCKEDKYSVSDEGDTTYTERSSEVRTFEVLAQTKDSYTLSITYSDIWNSDPSTLEAYQAILKECGPMTVLLRTNEMGSPESILNLDELVEYNKKAIEPMLRATMGDVKGADRKRFAKYLENKMCDPDVIINNTAETFNYLFTYHGLQLDTTQAYTYEEKWPGLLMASDSVQVETTTYVDSEFTDSVSAVIRSYSEVSEDDLKELVASSAAESGAAFAGKKLSDKKKDALKGFLSESLGELRMTMEQYTTLEVHLDSGWPLNFLYDRVVTTIAPVESEDADGVGDAGSAGKSGNANNVADSAGQSADSGNATDEIKVRTAQKCISKSIQLIPEEE